jgi:tetratricopeptide (TPR) repeat protein
MEVNTILLFIGLTYLIYHLLSFSVPAKKQLDNQGKMLEEMREARVSQVLGDENLDTSEKFLMLDDHDEAIELFERLLNEDGEVIEEDEVVLDDGAPDEPEAKKLYYLKDARKKYVVKWANAIINKTYEGDVEWETGNMAHVSADHVGIGNKKYVQDYYKTQVELDSGHFYIKLFRVKWSYQSDSDVSLRILGPGYKGMSVVEMLSYIDKELAQELYRMAKDSAENKVATKTMLNVVEELEKV